MAIKTWVLDDPITPTDLNRIEQNSYLATIGGTTTGNQTNFILTLDTFQLVDLVSVNVKFHADNMANPTLNINGTGAYPLYTTAGQQLAISVIKAGSVVQCLYNSALGRYCVLTGENGLAYTPVNKAGDTMTGALILNADPSTALGAATRQYADSKAYVPPYTPVNKAGDVMAGNLGINASPIQTFVGRSYISVKGTTNGGSLEFQTAAADLDSNFVGGIQFTDINSIAADKRIAHLGAYLKGSTSNNRGGQLQYAVKQDNGALTVRLTLDQNGAITTTNNTLDDGTGRITANLGATNNVAITATSSGAGWGSGIQLINTAPSGKPFGMYSDQNGNFRIIDVAASLGRIIIDPNGVVSTPYGLTIETRTTDPAGAAIGRMWFRTDL